MADVTEVRRRLVALSTGMYERSVPYIESALPESGARVPSHGRAVRDAAEGLIAGNVFLFTLAAVLRVAQESDHPAGPILAERMARIASEALNSGLDWLEGANDDLGEPEPPAQVPGQRQIPAGHCPDCYGTGLNIGRPGTCPTCGGRPTITLGEALGADR